MTTREVTTTGPAGEVAKREPTEAVPLFVTPGYVQKTLESIDLLRDMVHNLLKRGRDYGHTPGTQGDGLWDPGASIIIAGFNCYAGQRRILNLVDNAEKIAVIVEVPIISRVSGQEVGSGVGAASTFEAAFANRWLTRDELKEFGFTDEQIATLRTDKKHPNKWKIDNPDRLGLLNSLVKRASKRGEVDAAEALPGVASALREMFNPEKSEGRSKAGQGESGEEYEGPRWQRFWGECSRLGYTEPEVHAKLKVRSMKDWLAKGRSLDEALDVLRGKKPLEGVEQRRPGGEGDGPAPGTREYSILMIRSAAGKLGWNDKRLTTELQTRFQIDSIDKATDEKLNEAASKLTDLASAA